MRKTLVPLLFFLFCGLAAAQDCSFTYTFTGNSTQTGQPNLSAINGTPCVNWRLTLSVTGTLSTTVTFQTSPDNTNWTSVGNSVCSSSQQPPCIISGANPITGTQGQMYVSAYGAYVRVVISGSSGTGTGSVRAYGAKGASPSAGAGGGGGTGPAGPTGPQGPTGPTGPAGPGSVGAPGAVQIAAAANAFADGGCTMGSGTQSCTKYVATGTGAGSLVTFVPNAGSTGTTAKLLSKINGSGAAVIATTSDTAIPVFITLATDATIGCTAGTTGNACFASAGQGTCTADATGITSAHFVIASTVTGGRCRDGGATAPASVFILGIAAATCAGNADCTVQIMPASVGASAGGGTIPSTTNALKGDGAGNAAAVTGTASDCVHVGGGSGACPGGGSGSFVLVEQHTASTSAALNFTTCISSTYDEYVIEILSVIPTTNGVALQFQVSTNGGSSYDTGTNYAWSGIRNTRTGIAQTGADAGSSVDLGVGDVTTNSGSAGGLSGTMRFYQPSNGATSPRFIAHIGYNNGGSPAQVQGSLTGVYSPTTAVTAFRLIEGSGSTIASGTARCYGLAK